LYLPSNYSIANNYSTIKRSSNILINKEKKHKAAINCIINQFIRGYFIFVSVSTLQLMRPRYFEVGILDHVDANISESLLNVNAIILNNRKKIHDQWIF